MGKPANKPPRKNTVIVELDSVLLSAPRINTLITARVIEALVDSGFELIGLTNRRPSTDSFVRGRLLDMNIPISVVMMRGTLDERDYIELKAELFEMHQSHVAMWIDNDPEFVREMLHRGVQTLRTYLTFEEEPE